jgi:hypothetical protein
MISISTNLPDLIERILSNLGTIATGITELRNLYGTGHGSGPKSKGLEVRYARLVVTLSAALCEFLLSTYQSRIDTSTLWSLIFVQTLPFFEPFSPNLAISAKLIKK